MNFLLNRNFEFEICSREKFPLSMREGTLDVLNLYERGGKYVFTAKEPINLSSLRMGNGKYFELSHDHFNSLLLVSQVEFNKAKSISDYRDTVNDALEKAMNFYLNNSPDNKKAFNYLVTALGRKVIFMKGFYDPKIELKHRYTFEDN